MSEPALALLRDPFREEGDMIVYVAGEGDDPDRDTTWFFDEMAKRPSRSLLVDVRAVSGMQQGFRPVVYKRHHELDGRRVAIVGNGRVQEFLVGFLLAATGHADARFFHDEAAARAWLREEAHG